MTRVSAVVLAYGDEPWLEVCLQALAASTGVDVEVVVVDNGCARRDVIAQWSQRPDTVVVRPGTNLGYAGGCNTGAATASGDVLAFVNSDAVVEPDALRALAAAVTEPSVALACGSIRLAATPDRLNTAGNPLHYLGVVWAGHFDEPAAAHLDPVAVATVTGAAFAVRAAVWAELGGFPAEWFAYHEDSELSVRAWQSGRQVRFEPAAVVHHHYEFSRNARKLYLVERNRLLNVLTLYQLRTLVVLAPALLVFEFLMLALSAREGWLREKLRGYGWIAGHASLVRSRRRLVRRTRVRSDRDLSPLWSDRLEFANLAPPPGLGLLNAWLAGYWYVARRLL